jgi:hypothetical protein
MKIMAKNNTESKWEAIVTGLIDIIGVSDFEARLSVPARLQKARSEGFTEGYTARDKEMQPLIRQSEHEKELLKNEHIKHERQIVSLNQQLLAKDQELTKLKSERDKLKASRQQQLKAEPQRM